MLLLIPFVLNSPKLLDQKQTDTYLFKLTKFRMATVSVNKRFYKILTSCLEPFLPHLVTQLLLSHKVITKFGRWCFFLCV